MHIKPTKDLDEEFKRAQKPWAKLYVKVDKYKRDYHAATKNLKMAETQDNSAKLDGSVPQDQRVKVAEKVERFRKEKESIKGKYMEALQELNRANPKYMDDMNEVFSRCQTFEKDRLAKFREFFVGVEKCLDLTHRLQSANFQQFSQVIKNCDADKDLAWWSETYGAGMKMNWPTFEEYTEAQRSIVRRGKGELERENPVVMTGIRSNTSNTNNNNNNNNSNSNGLNSATAPDNRLSTNNAAFNEESDSTPASSYTSYNQPASAPADSSPGWVANSWTNPTDYSLGSNNGGHSSLPSYSNSSVPTYQQQTSYSSTSAGNPFYDEDDAQNGDSSSSPHAYSHQSPTSAGNMSFDSNSGGVAVRALYDYEAQEQDELSFRQGDVFTKIEDEDDQGWCKGRVGNRVGLYPATYVEIV